MKNPTKLALITLSSPTKDTNTFKLMKPFMALHNIELIPFDFDSNSIEDDISYYIFDDYSWRHWLKNKQIDKIPFEKRVLIMGEPANINPSLYYISFLRNKFNIIFAWDLKLLKKHPNYIPIKVPVFGTDYKSYEQNPFKDIQYSEKKEIVAVSMNRWSYMPQSNYRLRRKVYKYFETNLKQDFDLFGLNWNQPCIFYEKWLGYPIFNSWQGIIKSGWNEKIKVISKYKFAICFENNAQEPGYISEKILHCLCARCIPIYFGSKGIENKIPTDAYIDWRNFKDLDSLKQFILNISEEQYNQYINSINNFMQSDEISFFYDKNVFNTILKTCK
jgi:hypothetical protein